MASMLLDRKQLGDRLTMTLTLLVVLSGTSAVVSAGDVESYRLTNGLSVLLYPRANLEHVALVVLYDIGEDHDPEGQCGLSHLVEHLYVTAAAGNVPARTAQEFMQRYPKGWNAQTGADYTVFASVFPPDVLHSELEEAGARMSRLRPTEKDLTREKQRLLQELHNMYEGVPTLAAVNLARQRLYPSAWGRRKGGIVEHVQQLNLDDVRTWWADYYKAGNATLVLAGDFNSEDATAWISTAFTDIPAGKRPRAADKPVSNILNGTRPVTIRPNVPGTQPIACIAARAPAPGDRHYAPFVLLVSRLWMRAAAAGGQPRVVFAPLDDSRIVAVYRLMSAGERGEDALGQLRSFLDKTLGAPLNPLEESAVQKIYGPMLGLVDFPEAMLRQNLYGVAFSIGRQAQLGIDATQLANALRSLDDAVVNETVQSSFSTERQAAVIVTSEK